MAGYRGKIVVVLTQGRIHRELRPEFDRQTDQVAAAMSEQPGLLAYAVRRQLFGDTVWTFTAWESEQARARFVGSATHRRAIKHSGAAVLAMQAWRADLDVAQVPTTWDEALAMFA
jgi:heme-degrading monooxygenase HmoA